MNTVNMLDYYCFCELMAALTKLPSKHCGDKKKLSEVVAKIEREKEAMKRYLDGELKIEEMLSNLEEK